MWITEWRAISARIAALIEAATFATRTRQYEETGVCEVLLQGAREIQQRLRDLYSLHESELPHEPKVCLFAYLEDAEDDQRAAPGIDVIVITKLALFKAEFEYLMADTEAVVQSLVLRAFTHLQGSIAADHDVQKRWEMAFDTGERTCERLGACHLLLHGIWSFKADAAGARTDLVLGEQQGVWERAERTAEGLVLTEWKLVRNQKEVAIKAEEARGQARRYTTTPFGGFELASRRYLILVSKDRLDTPPDVRDDDVTYEHVNIAVAPKVPSVDARSTRRAQEVKG